MDSLMKLILFLAVSVIIMDWLLCVVILTNENQVPNQNYYWSGARKRGQMDPYLVVLPETSDQKKMLNFSEIEMLWYQDLENCKLRIASEHMIYTGAGMELSD